MLFFNGKLSYLCIVIKKKQTIMQINGNIIYGENGTYYKDFNAWNTNKGVIYISEGDLDDIANEMSDDPNFWTRESWVAWVKEHITINYQDEDCYQEMIECTEFIESLAYDCLYNADWQDLSTLLNDYDYNDDWVMTNWEEWKNK